MKKTIYILFVLCLGQISIAQQAYLGVTLSQDILALTAAPFGGTLTDEQLKEGLQAELVAMYSIYSRDGNYGCPIEKEAPLSEGTKPYEGKIVLVELEGDCPYGQKIAKVEAQGAIAVVLLQKEKNENFNLEGDEFANKSKIPCFILRDFEENTRLFRFAPSPALLYIASEGHGKALLTQQQNPSTLEHGQKESSIVETSRMIQVAPNPASDVLTVSYQIPLEIATLYLLDITGKEVFQKPLLQNSGSVLLETRNLSSGMYMVNIRYATGQVSQRLFIQ